MWPSPISPDLVVSAAVTPTEVQVAGDRVWWSETRPLEGGRIQLCVLADDGGIHDLLPEGWSARTRVHEYGGGAWSVDDQPDGAVVVFCRWDDQRVYRLELDGVGGAVPVPLTPEPTLDHGLRYADLRVAGGWVIAVRERHDGIGPGQDAVNEIVAFPLDGPSDGSVEPVVLVTGHDFVAAPRVSPAGDRMAWITWEHPDMPWDATQLWVGDVMVEDGQVMLSAVQDVAGGPAESVIQPTWSPDGTLHFLSDRTEWWNLYRWEGEGRGDPVTGLQSDIGTPPWVFGTSRYGFLDDGRVAVALTDDGVDRLAVVDGQTLTDVSTPYDELASLSVRGTEVCCIAAGFTEEPVVARIALDEPDGGVEVLRPARDLGLDPSWYSVASPVSFPSGPDGSRLSHALYYPPTNPDVEVPADEAPPLLVLIHGGPTSMARPRLDVAKQFWTSRGFALVDVNYGGSSGFGRAYRDLLAGNWGVVDVEDCIAAASYLAERGLADADRLCIRGGSAGGFTVLSALARSDVFAAGASSYGVADLTALAEETHKFESRYLDGLIGPYPEARALYDERSPVHHVDDLNAPLIVFQGLEDEIVPPNQSEMIVEALRARDVPVEYHAFEGEQHGFRRSETVTAVLEAELAFYRRVLAL